MQIIHHHWIGPDGELHTDIVRPEDFYLPVPSRWTFPAFIAGFDPHFFQERPLTQFDDTTDAGVIHSLSRLAEQAIPVGEFSTGDGRRFVGRRNDFVLEQITLPNAAEVLMPKLVTQSPSFLNAASLIDYVNRFKDGDSVTFANVDSGLIQTVLDYHRFTGGEAQPRLGLHVANLPLPHSEEWGRWTGQNEKLMRHTEFASFLEENSFDVSSPPGTELLELCRDLQVRQDVKFSSSIRMGDTAKVSYQKEGDATTKDEIALPTSFMISIPVYFGEPNVSIVCFMRRQISDGVLKLGYKMIRLQQIKQAEFARVVGSISTGTQITTLYGKRS